MAALGLFVLPHRRRKAKVELKQKLGTLRTQLMTGLTGHFEKEAARGRRRLEETIAPYTRFVRAESERLGGQRDRLEGLTERVGELQARVSSLSS
jgi:hypothetical protein